MIANPQVLVTGADSFIGGYFAAQAPKGYVVDEVCVKKNKVKTIDFRAYDTVFHVAAIVHQTSKVPDSVYFKVNSDLAVEVAKKAKAQGVKQFVFMSTAKVYGENSTEESPWKEDTECLPSDAYGKSKLDAERRLNALNDDSFMVSVIRTPVVYGAHVKGNIHRMAQYIHATRMIPLNGINNKRAMIYIGNLMAMIYRIIDRRKAGLFLAGDRRNISTSELAQYMIDGTGRKKNFFAIPSPFQRIVKVLSPRNYMRVFGSMVIDCSRTFEVLEFEPPYLVADGVQEVMDDIRMNMKLRNRFFTF